MFIAIERYLKVFHPKKLRKWMTYEAAAIAWVVGFVHLAVGFETSAVIDGVCIAYVFWKSLESRIGSAIYYFIWTYVTVLVVVTFCYGKILIAVRRQVSVMASHDATESNIFIMKSYIKHKNKK